MQKADELKSAFSMRVNEICVGMGLPERGRQTALAKLFEVTPNAARKWLLGDGYPEMEMAVRLADWADVNVNWLLQGVGPKRGDRVDTRPSELLEAVKTLPEGQQVFDFIRYKFERANGWFASEKLAKYTSMLDNLAKKPPPRKAPTR